MNPKIYYGNRPQPYFERPSAPERRDLILSSRRMQIERKSFSIEVRENHRGRFLSIVEEGRSRSMIIVPSTGLAEFKTLMNEVLTEAEAKPMSEPGNFSHPERGDEQPQ